MRVARLGSVLAEALQLLRGDLARVAEHLRGQRRVRIAAKVDLDDADAGELGLVLVEVVDLLLADRRLHDDRGQRVETSRVDLTRELPRLDVEDTGQAPHELVAALRWACRPPRARPPSPRRSRRPIRPRRSRIGPRGASTRMRRSWFDCAAFRYSSPDSTWSDQRRKNRTTKTRSANAPRIATRSASCGVSRCGSRTRGSGGRNRPDGARCSWYGPDRHRWRSTSTSADGSARCSSPTIARTSRWTGSARMRFSTNAGASAVTSACRATTSSASR